MNLSATAHPGGERDGGLSGLSGGGTRSRILFRSFEHSSHQHLERFLPLLFGGLQNRGEHGLCARASFGTVAAPVLARANQSADRSLANVVGGVEPRAIEESEQVR